MAYLLYEELTYKIIGAAKEVYEELGSGYLESVYEDALCYELDKLNIRFERQTELNIHYKDTIFKKRFRADLIVNDKVLVEIKAIKTTASADEAQLINYLKTTKIRIGLSFNFGGQKFEMIRRIV